MPFNTQKLKEIYFPKSKSPDRSSGLPLNSLFLHHYMKVFQYERDLSFDIYFQMPHNSYKVTCALCGSVSTMITKENIVRLLIRIIVRVHYHFVPRIKLSWYLFWYSCYFKSGRQIQALSCVKQCICKQALDRIACHPLAL